MPNYNIYNKGTMNLTCQMSIFEKEEKRQKEKKVGIDILIWLYFKYSLSVYRDQKSQFWKALRGKKKRNA